MYASPLVSVIVASYNHEAFLSDFLESVLAQDYPNIELIICDDCSQDQSYDVILSYRERLARRFHRIELLRNSANLRLTRNVNRMLAITQGVYVKFIASDDAMTPDAISKMVQFMETHSEYGVAISNGVRMSEDCHYPNFVPIAPIYSSEPNFSMPDLLGHLITQNPVFAPGAFIRKAVYEKYGYYDEKVEIEDLEYWLRLVCMGGVKFGYIDERLVYYRLNSSSLSSTVSSTGLEDRRRRMHSSWLNIVGKYKTYIPVEIYGTAILNRTMYERRVAVVQKMFSWDDDLKKLWWRQFRGNKLPIRCHLASLWKYFKINVKRGIAVCKR